MTYEITPKHFGITTWIEVLLAVGTLACFVLLMFILQLIWPSPTWSWRELVTGILTWLGLQILWYFQTHYSLEVDDNSVRITGGRVVLKGHVRYLREFNSQPWRGGPRLVLSERTPGWVRVFGGVIVIPKSVPEYGEIKKMVSTWMVSPVAHAA